MSVLNNRYEFALFFDVENGNPNGDPDAGNLPRIDPETGHGLVTDVCLKRKARNYVELIKNDAEGFNIYVQEKAVLNQRHAMAYEALKLDPAAKKKTKGKAANDNGEDKALTASDYKRLTAWMCKNFYDIRAFGAVMTTEVNCGQVRGPLQLTFAKSVEPIIVQEIAITRMAVTNEKDLEKEKTMGRKYIVPYGLYRAEGYVSAKLAEKTLFSEADLELFWGALLNMFEHDHSAARGKMSSRRLVIFKHDDPLGKAPAQRLFDLVAAARVSGGDGPARSFSDYNITVDQANLPQGVTVELRS